MGRDISTEALRDELKRLQGVYDADHWTGSAEDVYQAYGELARDLEAGFPKELKLALLDYEQGQIDARTRDIVLGQNKLMRTLQGDQQWGNQEAINQAKSAVARELQSDLVFQKQRTEYAEALTTSNEHKLDMVYDAERATLKSLGLDQANDTNAPTSQEHTDSLFRAAEILFQTQDDLNRIEAMDRQAQLESAERSLTEVKDSLQSIQTAPDKLERRKAFFASVNALDRESELEQERPY